MNCKKTVAWLLLSVMLFSCFVGCTKDGAGDGTDTDPQKSGGQAVIQNGESDYHLVYREGDQVGYLIAQHIQKVISNVTGIKIKTRKDTSSFTKGILVGDTSLPETQTAKAKLESDKDFILDFSGENVVVYASSPDVIEIMLLTLEDIINRNYDSETGILMRYSSDSLIYSLDKDKASAGSVLTLSKNKIADYVLACDSNDASAMSIVSYIKTSLYGICGAAFRTADYKSDKASGKKILIAVRNVYEEELAFDGLLDKDNDFAVCVDGDNVIIAATSTEDLLIAAIKFLEQVESADGSLILKEEKDYVSSRFDRSYSISSGIDAKEYCELYQSIFKTFSRDIDKILALDKSISETNKADHRMVMAMLNRMGKSFVFEVGSSSMLYNGKVRKLDASNYSLTATKGEGGELLVPAAFAMTYLNTNLNANANGKVDLSAFCGASEEYTLTYHADKNIYIMTPSDVSAFDDADKKTDGLYTDGEYVNRMHGFFHNSIMPEPENNTEQTRVVVEYVEYPMYVVDYTNYYYDTMFSPAIAIDQINGQKTIYVAFEICEMCYNPYDERATVTVIKKSTDGGKSWSECGRIEHLRWASLFIVDHVVYVMGNHLSLNTAMIAKLDTNGTLTSADLGISAGGSAPGAVVFKDGKVWRAYAKRVLSASLDSDLLNSSSWTASEDAHKLISVAWLRSVTGLALPDLKAVEGGEPNLVIGEDGELYCFWRFDKVGTGVQLVMRVIENGTRFEMLDNNGTLLTGFPNSKGKVTIRYDEVTGKYFALTNPYLGGQTADRTKLALAVSDDMLHWEIVDYVLVSRDLENAYVEQFYHAFQYADFVIDGDDIVLVVREAADYTSTYHDGNYTTMYTIKNFRDMLR